MSDTTKSLPPILDVACGGRMFWFDKNHPDALFVDKRVMPPTEVGHGIHKRIRKCEPDMVMDFRNLDLPDDQFSLVVFDPPHLILGKNSHTAKVYGSLDKETWQDDLTKGFAECFRVLKPEGVLVFKWHEFDIPLKEILKLTPHQPLFGHKSGKAQLTHWLCFMKPIQGNDLAAQKPLANTDVANPPKAPQDTTSIREQLRSVLKSELLDFGYHARLLDKLEAIIQAEGNKAVRAFAEKLLENKIMYSDDYQELGYAVPVATINSLLTNKGDKG